MVTFMLPGVTGMLPVNPDTLIGEGYSEPFPIEGIVIAVEFVKVVDGVNVGDASTARFWPKMLKLPNDTSDNKAKIQSAL
jgi:hypothetical protein